MAGIKRMPEALNRGLMLFFSDEVGNPLESIKVTYDGITNGKHYTNSLITNSYGYICDNTVFDIDSTITYNAVDLQGRYADTNGTALTVSGDIVSMYKNVPKEVKIDLFFLESVTVVIMKKSGQTLSESVEKITNYKKSIINLYATYCLSAGSGFTASYYTTLYNGFSMQYYINKIEEKLKG